MKFPSFYGTRRFITAVTSARHLSLSWASSIQAISPLPEDPFLHIITSALSALRWRFIVLLGSTLLYSVPVLSFLLARQLSGNVLVDAGFPLQKVTVLGETKKEICTFYNLHETYVNWRLSVLWDSRQGLSGNSVSLPKQWSPNLAPLTGQSSVTIAAAVIRRHPNERTPVSCKRDHTDS